MSVKILVIEDADELRENIRDLLLKRKFDVIEAPNGKIGLELARENSPDLILCDIMMPEMNGYEVLQEIRKDDDLKFVSFIFLSAKTDKHEIRMGMNMNADDYLTKPFRKEDLYLAIDSKLTKYSEMKKLLIESAEKSEELLKKFFLNSSEYKGSEGRNLDLSIEGLTNALDEKDSILNKIKFMNSHELRASLSNILGILQMMKANPDKSKDAFPLIEKNARNIDTLLFSLEEVLDSSESRVEFHKGTDMPLQNYNFILIDDDDIQHEINSAIIKDRFPEAEVLVFNLPKNALAYIKNKSGKPTVLFLDLNMPEMNGWEFLDSLSPDIADLEIYILTSSIDHGDSSKARTYPFVKGFIPKPLTMQKFSEIFC